MTQIKLLETRLKKGISQEELAEFVGMSQSNYSRREKGITKISESEWQRIAKGLGVKKEEIQEEKTITITYKNIDVNSSGNSSERILSFYIPEFALQYIEILKTKCNDLEEKNSLLQKQLQKKQKKES
jgi:transcriptional regulator with XRE-family HTH domain